MLKSLKMREKMPFVGRVNGPAPPWLHNKNRSRSSEVQIQKVSLSWGPYWPFYSQMFANLHFHQFLLSACTTMARLDKGALEGGVNPAEAPWLHNKF